MRKISARLGVSRQTVKRAVEEADFPQYLVVKRESIVDPYVDEMQRILTEYPAMSAPTLARRVGYTGGSSTFRAKVSEIKALLQPPDPVDRLEFGPGELIQCDLWFPNEKIIPSGFDSMLSPPVLTMVCGYSRWIMARMIPSRSTGDLIAGMAELLDSLGAVPLALLWDNEAGIGRGGKLTDPAQRFAGTLGLSIKQTRPYDPESKGLVERANQYLQSSFLPGQEFTSLEQFNELLDDWLATVANTREVRRLNNKTPAQVIREDLAAMRPLPPIMPRGGFTDRRKLSRDYLFRVLGNDYSCPPEYIGRMIDIHASLDTVVFSFQGKKVASHDRCIDSGKTVISPEHQKQAEYLRHAYQHRNQSRADSAQLTTVERRNLADYDEVFGIDINDGGAGEVPDEE